MARWSRESIIAALKRWHAETGESPGCDDWDTRGPNPHWIRHRGEFPTQQTVRNHFGSWLVGLKAADLEPRPHGRPKNSQDGDWRYRPSTVRKRLEARKAVLEEELAAVKRELGAT